MSRLRRDTLAVLAITSACCAVWSQTAQAAPPNDRFSDAIELRAGQAVEGTVRGAERQAGETQYFGPRLSAVWYRFRAPRTGLIGVRACAHDPESYVYIFTGRALSSLNLRRYSDSGGSSGCAHGFRIEIKLPARRGVRYSIAVTGSRPRSAFRLTAFVIRRPPNDDFADARPFAIGSSQAGTTVGSTAERSEPRHCCGPPHTVWYRLRVRVATQVRLYACGQSGPNIAVYRGSRVDRLTEVGYFAFCVVQFAAEPGVTYHVALDDRGWWGAFKLLSGAVTPPPNDDFADATAMALGTAVTGTTLFATREPGEPSSPVYPAALFTVWFRLDVGTPGVIRVEAPCNVHGATKFDVYTGDDVKRLQPVPVRPLTGEPGECPFEFDASPGIHHLRAGADLFDEGAFEFSARAVP
jgi:hypothetical protein